MAKSGSTLALITVLLIGFVLGTLLGELLNASLPFLSKGVTLQANLNSLNYAKAMSIGDTFAIAGGFRLKITIATIIGVVVAYLVYRKI